MATLDSDAPDAKGGLGVFLRKITWTAVIAAVVLVVTLFIARPTGATRFEASNEGLPADVLEGIFSDAEARTRSAFDAHSTLSRQIAGDAVEPLPLPQYTDRPSTFRSIVESLGVTVDYDDATGNFKGAFNLVAFFEALYGALGLTDYFVTVTLLEETPCQEEAEADECWRMNVRYTPPLVLGETLQGTREELASDLAVYVMRGIAGREGKIWRERTKADGDAVPPFLLYSSTPNTLARLKAASEGLSILGSGCTGQPLSGDRRACLSAARDMLQVARTGGPSADNSGSTPSTPPAALGLALLALHDAVLDGKAGRPALDIERRLAEMETFLREARLSKFLMGAIERDGVSAFDYLLGDIEVNGALLTGTPGANFPCALTNYRRANWGGCLAKSENIGLLPETIRPYFEAPRFDARLYESETDAESAEILSELRGRIEAIENDALIDTPDWPLRLVEYRHLCSRGAAGPDELRALRDALLVRLPSSNRRRLASLMIAACEGSEIPEDKIAEMKAHFQGQRDSYEKKILYLEIARHYAALGDLEKAVGAAEQSLKLPWATDLIFRHPDFRLIASHGDSMTRLLDARENVNTETGLEACGESEVL